MFKRKAILAQAACLLIVSIFGYDPTVPTLIYSKCVVEYCVDGTFPVCFTPVAEPDCSAMYGCGYTGPAQDVGTCPAGLLTT